MSKNKWYKITVHAQLKKKIKLGLGHRYNRFGKSLAKSNLHLEPFNSTREKSLYFISYKIISIRNFQYDEKFKLFYTLLNNTWETYGNEGNYVFRQFVGEEMTRTAYFCSIWFLNGYVMGMVNAKLRLTPSYFVISISD